MDETNIIRGINSAIKKVEGRFCCGGSLPLPQGGIRIWYTKKDDSQGLFHLPTDAYDDTGIDDLLEESLDTIKGNYIHELQLSSFATNFDLGSYFIVDEITKLLGPGAVLRAQLQKLTVIVTGGDSHPNDSTTPPSSDEESDAFGYLIVTLPFAYTGGDMRVRKSGSRINTFTSRGSTDSVQWVAFVAGCEKLISEVTSGYQITLTYKLYRLVESNKRKRVLGVNDTLVEPETLPLYDLWIEATNTASFCPGGGVLAFACQERYPLSDELMNRDDKAWLLRGPDAMLYAAAKAAGLKAEFRPVYRNSNDENPALLYVGKIVGEKAPGFAGEFREGFDDLDRDTASVDDLPKSRDGFATDATVKWCLKNLKWVTGRESGQYRNEQVDVSWYYSAAIVVTIPAWCERKGGAEEAEERQEAKRAKMVSEAISEWFRRAEEQASLFDSEYRVEDDEEGGGGGGDSDDDDSDSDSGGDSEEDEEDEEEEEEEDGGGGDAGGGDGDGDGDGEARENGDNAKVEGDVKQRDDPGNENGAN